MAEKTAKDKDVRGYIFAAPCRFAYLC